MIYSEAWNFLAASGQGSLGHAAFFGIGAYASALIATGFGLPPILTSCSAASSRPVSAS